MKLYHYTTLEHFKGIWKSKQLLFSTYKNTNDLFERIKAWSLYDGKLTEELYSDSILKVIEKFGKMFNEVLQKYKQISLTRDYAYMPGYASPMMWGQYARNNGNGVCIEIDSNLLHFTRSMYRSKIKYVNDVPLISVNAMGDIIDRTFLESYVKTNRKLVFFTKHKHWQHENEYRVISSVEDGLYIGNAITNIYVFGLHDANALKIYKMVNEEVPIRFLAYTHENGVCKITSSNYGLFKHYEEKIKENPDGYTNQAKVKVRL